MRTLLRNTLAPLLLVGPCAAFCWFMAFDTTRKVRDYLAASLAFPLMLCLTALIILWACLRRQPSAAAMVGFLIGAAIGATFAMGGGFFGLMMLTFSGDGGMQNAASVLPWTLSFFAALVLTPLTLGAALGALIGQRSAQRKLETPTT